MFFFKDSVIHSLVHSTVPVHFPVKRLEMPIPKSIPFTEIVHCLLTHHLTLHLLNFEHHCTRRLMFTFQLIVIACALHLTLRGLDLCKPLKYQPPCQESSLSHFINNNVYFTILGWEYAPHLEVNFLPMIYARL